MTYESITDVRAPLATHWMEQIKHGLEYRKKFSSQKQWKHYRNMYRGEWEDGIVPVNRVFSYGRSLMPKVYFRAPYVTVTPRRPEFAPHARVLEAVDNMLIRETHLKRTLKRAALIAYIEGTAPIKLGYDSQYGFIPELSVDRDMATATQFGRKQARAIEYHTGIKPGMPWALPESTANIIVPYGYQMDLELPWIAHRILRPLKDVKQDQKYRNTSELKGSRLSMIEGEDKANAFFKDSKIEYAELFEIRDKSEQRLLTLCEDKILLNEHDALQIEGLPWEFLIFNEDPDYFFGISDVKQLTPQQLELNEVRTQQSRHRKIALLKFLAKKGVLAQGALDAFLSGETGPFIEVDDDQINAAIMLLQPHVPPEFSGLVQEIQDDMRQSMGFSENQTGQFSPYHGKTATETMEVAQSNDLRDMERKDMMSDILVNIVRKWNQYLFSFWDEERVIEVAGPDGQLGWVSYTGEQLRGEYTVSIDPDSGFPVTRSLRTQAADNLLKMYGGDLITNQLMLRAKHLEQYEWIFPGVTKMLINVDPLTAQLLSQQRQPGEGTPEGLMSSMGNRGGGRTAGNTKGAASFEQYAKQQEQGSGGE